MKERMEIKNLDELYEAILHLETVEECRSFFKDLCTIPELKALSQRFQVARMLMDNHVYSEIVHETGASTATISRVNRSLTYDGSGGYSIVFEKMNKEKENDKK
ncbi:MAG: TrpR-like protein, YerC/YecD [Ruminococcus sp.]|nr:TrpR-like protein, YerC/YecD [Ruminococcus sp.]MBQ3935572.1 TrpR-like protein, YerC/YecD [Ruminococcus sp.]MBQ9870171.1 TrpR-like protein, YerC/YecD [Ruminococcus sp.]MCR5479395.1 TrpR-like protein, YerC/YecD [Ruminococcus sp.]